MSIDKSAAARLGVDSADNLEDALFSSDEIALPRGSSVEVTDRDGRYEMTVTLQSAPLESQDMRATRLRDGRIRFEFRNAASAEAGVLLDDMAADITLRLVFPGAIVEAGDRVERIDATTARISIGISEEVDTFIVSEASANTSDRNTLIVGSGILAAGLAMAVVFGRRRNAPPLAESSSSMRRGTHH